MNPLQKIAALLCLIFASANQLMAQPMTESWNEPDPVIESSESNDEFNDVDVDAVFDRIVDEKKSLVRDGAYDRVGAKDKVTLAYDDIREADVFWSKRIWREIDVRQKRNLSFASREQPLIAVLFSIMRDNPEVKLYTDDSFTEEYSKQDLVNKLELSSTVEVYDIETDQYIQKQVANDFNPQEYQKYRLKEDWIFDEEAGQMVCRIVGIAPIRDVIDENGLMRGQEALFWMHYPGIRDYLVKFESINPQNDAIRLTWEDIFEMRFFDSQITRESTADSRRIKDYATGREAARESEEIKQKVFNFEHDLWSY